MIHIFTESTHSQVVGSSLYEKTYEASGSSGNFIFDYTFDELNSGYMWKSLIILECLKYNADYVLNLIGNNPLPFCIAHYPYNDNSCHYSNNNIYIIEPEEDPIFLKSFWSFDVVGHEYGHHLENSFNFSANVGGTHLVSRNLIDFFHEGDPRYNIPSLPLNQAIEKGLKLAWNEGWATFYSITAQQTFPFDIKNIHYVGDSSYNSYNGLNYNLDSYRYRLGDACEGTISNLLYKLSSSNNDQYDTFTISLNEIWRIITGYRPTSLSAFINGLYEENYNEMEIGKLLSHFNITTNNISVSDNSVSTSPTFSWTNYRGSNYLYYDSFEIYIYNDDFDLIHWDNNLFFITNNIYNYTMNYTYWLTILNEIDSYFYVSIYEKQNLSYGCGNYYSSPVKFYKPS